MKHKNQPVDWSAATKYWGKTKFSDARKPIERAFFTQLFNTLINIDKPSQVEGFSTHSIFRYYKS